MKISLNVLNHLGINLYSNIPAVLAETVANAWDADAEKVAIKLDTAKGIITITDNGHGMTRDEVNDKYLCVGYRRRDKAEERLTPKYRRPVMGRKGIGKLSLFSIAREVEVQTIKDGIKSGFSMSLKKIEDQIRNESGKYYPDPFPEEKINIRKGTKITLTDLKKDFGSTGSFLRRRLARRFSIIGLQHKFSVVIDGTPISIADRDYYGKLEFLWYYGEKGKEAVESTPNATHKEERSVDSIKEYGAVEGWIGTVKESGNLKDDEDNLNRIVLMVRDKLAQENILDDFNEGRLFTKYIIGEIHADFLDLDEKEDIATSNRQKVVEDDPRYLALKKFIKRELNHIALRWDDLRKQEGTKEALQIPAIEEWYRSLDRRMRQQAESLFGKINQIKIDDPEDKKQLLKQGILAFESLRFRDLLDELERITPENLSDMIDIFHSLDEIEVSLYGQIARERVEVIKTLQDKVEENVREKVLQDHLFNNLWLLDPAWERATPEVFIESTVKKEFGKIDAALAKELGITRGELAARRDIKYTTYARKHVIIELKRANRRVSTTELIDQIEDYREALFKILEKAGRAGEPIETICVVGTDLAEWTDARRKNESEKTLAAKNTRVVTYQRLIDSAYQAYSEYLKKHQEANRIQKILEGIDQASFQKKTKNRG